MDSSSGNNDAQLATSDVARILGISSDRVRQLAKAGALRFTSTPYGRLFNRLDVQALLLTYEAARTDHGRGLDGSSDAGA
jgi:excisionase family DNA binding protein